jgi:hypothetical protein
MAVAMGDHCGAKVSGTRIGFRHLPALYELPYDILRFALPTQEERDQAERDFWAAKFHRYGGSPETIALRRTQDSARWEARNDVGRRVKSLSELANGVLIVPIPNPSQDGYHCMNPSVCVHEGRIITTIRTVNYTMDDRGRYNPPEADAGVIKTQNYLADVSPVDFSTSNVRPIVDRAGRVHLATQVQGYEDMRLVSVGGQLYGVANVRDNDPSMLCTVAIGLLADNGDITREWVQPTVQNEKNWMPFAHDWLGLSFVYSIDPTVIMNFDPSTGLCREIARSTPTLGLDHLRGGSQAVRLPKDDGWLVVTHEVAIMDDKRCYLHRFVRLDESFRVTHVSHAWRLRSSRIEFVAGMVLHDEKIVLSAGLADHEACFAILDVKEALRLASEIQA